MKKNFFCQFVTPFFFLLFAIAFVLFLPDIPTSTSYAVGFSPEYSLTAYGVYDTGGSQTSGYFDKFRIYFYSYYVEADGILENNSVLNWDFVNIGIEVNGIQCHNSFSLTKDGENFYVEELGGSVNRDLFNGHLPNGKYVLNYSGTYVYLGTRQYNFTFNFTVDASIPSAKIYANEIVLENNSFTNAEYIKYESEGKCYVRLPKQNSFKPYISATKLYDSGTYTFYTESTNGDIKYYTVTIDRTKKPLELQNVTYGITYEDVIISWQDEKGKAPVKEVTINGVSCANGSTVYTVYGGAYNVVCEDLAGNKWTTYFTSYKKNIQGSALINEYYETSDINETTYSFASYDSAFIFAMEREKSLVQSEIWNGKVWDAGIEMDSTDSSNAKNGKYFIYKKASNPTQKNAYFTEKRLNEVICEYVSLSIKKYYYWEKSPEPAATNENLFSLECYVNAASITPDKNYTIFIDGRKYFGGEFEIDGRHTIEYADLYGNSHGYTVCIVGNPPDVRYSVSESASHFLKTDREYYFDTPVTFFVSDKYDKTAMLTIIGNNDIIGLFTIDESYTLSSSGHYKIKAVNHSGFTDVFNVYISLDPPEILFETDSRNNLLNIDIKNCSTEDIQTLAIYRSTDNGTTWKALTVDDFNVNISASILGYTFSSPGDYKVVITDKFRSGINAITVLQRFTLSTSENIDFGVLEQNESLDPNPNANSSSLFKIFLVFPLIGLLVAIVIVRRRKLKFGKTK